MKIKSKKQGAELTSIIVNEKEKLHQGKSILDEEGNPFWNRHAPILFPIVGQLKEGKTLINGKEYKMGQHGFARDMDFIEIEKNDKIHKYILKYNDETLKKYPFKFELEVCYEIKNENTLSIKYKVKNIDNKEIQFGLGGHPAFICDYKTGEYELEFKEREDKIKFLKLKNGLISNEQSDNLIEEGNKIKLNNNTFDNDSLILTNIKSNTITLKNHIKNEKLLEFDFTGFPYLGIWSKKGAPFVCIEPWYNTADNNASSGIFERKENILKLPSKEDFKCEYLIKFF